MKASKLAKSVRNIKEKMEEEKDSSSPVQAKATPETVSDSKSTPKKANAASKKTETKKPQQQPVENNEPPIRKIPANRVWPD